MPKNIELLRKLGLGTVQFGMAYGIANQGDRVRKSEIGKIMELARSSDIKLFDTAAGYQRSEEVLGPYFNSYDKIRIVTKTPFFDSASTSSDDVDLLRSTFDASLAKLQVNSVYGLLFHRCTDLFRPESQRLWAEMQRLKDQDKVQKIGVSVYTPEQLERLLDQFPIEIVQLPMNILDQRFATSGLLRLLHEEGVEVHIRSVFLQGVLLTKPESLPEYFAPLRPHLTDLHQAAFDANTTMLGMALNFALLMNEVNTVLVGVDTVAQFSEIVDSVWSPSATLDMQWDQWAKSEYRWINPTEWKLDSKN